ncbi:MAG: hypothetical protein OXH09_16115 [Gammaproteobacteria bacterium]|nr:hypothetical protein [Gammaproteobacteria bacterium]
MFTINGSYQENYEQGVYGCLIAKPSRRVQRSLGIDREVLAVVSTFRDQQTRTITFVQNEIEESLGRYESSLAIVIHNDPQGNEKLKNWGKEKGISILPIRTAQLGSGGEKIDLLRTLCFELYSYDPFDVTGPVSDDQHFFGRREEAIDLARKLQGGQIRSCLGIRKVGKTSIINRVLHEIRRSHECICIMIDCSGDDIWSMSAAQLLSSMARTLDYAIRADSYATVLPTMDKMDITTARNSLEKGIIDCKRPVLFVFDEVDYITPGSPTEKKWRTEFNVFWRNLRRVFQECDRREGVVSILVSGVSSYWFTVESIAGIENAALSFIPEEYLNPMPLGATTAMLRRLGNIAGLAFDSDALEAIATSSGNMPYWARKCCSYIHRQVPVSDRPQSLNKERVTPLIDDFIAKEGVAISEVALSHLFRVHPLLRDAVLRCYEGNGALVTDVLKSVLVQYGILTEKGEISGSMVQRALASLELGTSIDASRKKKSEEGESERALGPGEWKEWAEEIATIGKRRNIVERQLRSIVVNFVRMDSLSKPGGLEKIKRRILRVVPSNERQGFEHVSAQDTVSRFTWQQLTKLVEREWRLFERIFGNKKDFTSHCEIVNDRVDAHAKSADHADIALYRRSLGWLEERLARIE